MERRWSLVWAGIALFLALGIALLCPAAVSETRAVTVIAHRGGAGEAPENTIAALEQAIADGVTLAEFDLRQTADGVVVALHDASLLRTAGLDLPIWAADSHLLVGTDVPALDELLEAAQGRIGLVLDLKDGKVLEPVVEEIRRRKMENSCVIACTDPAVLRRSKTLAPAVETMYIGRELFPAIEGADWLDSCSLCWQDVSSAELAQARRMGLRVWVWTVNTPEEIQGAVAAGVDGVVTDEPRLAMEWIG